VAPTDVDGLLEKAAEVIAAILGGKSE
jgi:hypothetical protein